MAEVTGSVKQTVVGLHPLRSGQLVVLPIASGKHAAEAELAGLTWSLSDELDLPLTSSSCITKTLT